MRQFMLRARDIFISKIGRCERCMRQSLAAALLAWGLFGIGQLVWPASFIEDLISIAAACLTSLWLLHVATYAARAVKRLRPEGTKRPNHSDLGAVSASAALDEAIDRRTAFATVARTAGFGVLASIPIALWPTASFAFCGQCTKNADCGVGWVCRNTAPVNSGKVCNECMRA